MITEWISQWAIGVLDTSGYLGAGVLMALESMVVPIPSEAVMPFVGFQVADGKWSLPLALLLTSLGSAVGSLISYSIGYAGGKPLVLKAGKYLLLNVHDLERTEAFFHRNAGAWTIFLGRFVPVIRHFISIPAGTGKMPLLPFLTATVAGATLWNGFLLVCGMKLRDHWSTVERYSHGLDIAVAVFLLLGLGWWVYDRLRRNRPKAPERTV